MEDIRVCIIGAGRLATRRIYPYIGAAGAVLTGVCDLDQAKAATNARRFGGNAYTNYEEMLSKEKPDAVMICIGPEQHAALAPKVMRMGFPVYTEKPSAPNAQQALEVARVSTETGIFCMTAFKKRYNVAYSRAKEWITKFPPNDLYSISLDYASQQYANTSLATNFLHDFTIHIIDLTSYLFGDVEQVFCFAKGLDAYAVSLKFANGAVGTMNLNCGRSFIIPTEEVEISIKGGNFMSIHNSSCWKIAETKTTEWREPPTFTSSGDSGNDTGHFAEIVAYFDAVKKGTTTRSDIYESYKSMLLYEAIKESSETGKVVSLAYEQL
jgi:predicted dehydrogenase